MPPHMLSDPCLVLGGSSFCLTHDDVSAAFFAITLVRDKDVTTAQAITLARPSSDKLEINHEWNQ